MAGRMGHARGGEEALRGPEQGRAPLGPPRPLAGNLPGGSTSLLLAHRFLQKIRQGNSMQFVEHGLGGFLPEPAGRADV